MGIQPSTLLKRINLAMIRQTIILGLIMFTSFTQAEGNEKGAEVYNQACVMCHAAGISNAPLVHNQEQWGKLKSKGMDVLLNNAVTGINQMPPRGLCMSCTDEDLAAAIRYMMSESE